MNLKKWKLERKCKVKVYSKERGLRILKPGVDLVFYAEKYPGAVEITGNTPSQKTLERWVSNGIAKAVDGCQVEPDGECSHGLPSWLIAMGLI